MVSTFIKRERESCLTTCLRLTCDFSVLPSVSVAQSSPRHESSMDEDAQVEESPLKKQKTDAVQSSASMTDIVTG